MKLLRPAKPLLIGLAMLAGSGAVESRRLVEPMVAEAPADPLAGAVLARPFGAQHDSLDAKLRDELTITESSLSASAEMQRLTANAGPGIRWGLEHRGKHLELMRRQFELYGVPGDIAIKPFIESNGIASAVSPANAQGMSQLSVDNNRSLAVFLGGHGIAYEYTDWLTQLGAAAACDLFNSKAADNSFLLGQVIYNAGEGSLIRLLRDGEMAVHRTHGSDVQLPALAYAFIARPITREVSQRTDIGAFRTQSSEYMLKFAAFIPELRQALREHEQEPIYRYVLTDELSMKELSKRTGVSLDAIKELNEHALRDGAVFNSPIPLQVEGLRDARQLQDISAAELALTRHVMDYRAPFSVPHANLIEAARAHNDWRRAVGDEYERLATQSGEPSLYGLLGAWAARNCGTLYVPGERTAAVERNQRFQDAFSTALPKYAADMRSIISHFAQRGQLRTIYRTSAD